MDGLVLRPEQPEDTDDVDDVVRHAFAGEFGSDGEVELVRTLRGRGELVADLTLVATLDEQIVGYVALSEVTIDRARAGGLGLAPVAVSPEHQGQGVGAALIVASLERAEAAGWRFVVLLGHDDYYPRFGFVPAAPLGVNGDYGDGPSWMVRTLTGGDPTRGHVRYCSAFTDPGS